MKALSQIPNLVATAIIVSIAFSTSAAAQSLQIGSEKSGAWGFISSTETTPEAIDHFRDVLMKSLEAIRQSDLSTFVFRGDESFKKMEKRQFDAMTASWGAKLKSGFEISYLGDLNRGTRFTMIWRVRFRDGSYDAVVTLSAGKKGSITHFEIE
jgi:hypothetical protein